MADVFLSYSRKDAPFVHTLQEALKEQGMDVWVDFEGIPPSAEWRQEIAAAIQGADAFVFVLSPDSAASKVCGEELAEALKYQKRLVPVVRRTVSSKEVAPELAKLNWVYCREDDSQDKALGLLLEAIRTDLPWVKAHTRLLTRALEWDANHREGGYLLRGKDLADAEAWLGGAAGREPPPQPLQTQYILSSRALATRRTQALLGAIMAALVVSVSLTVFALIQRSEARIQARVALYRGLSAQAGQQAEEHLDLALLLAGEAANFGSGKPETRKAMVSALQRSPHLESFLHTAARGQVLVVSIVEDRAFALTEDNILSVWSMAGHAPIGLPIQGPPPGRPNTDASLWPEAVLRAALSPDARWVASTTGDDLIVWNADTGEQRFRVPDPVRLTNQVAFSPDGTKIALASDDNGTAVIDAASGKETARFVSRGAREVAFSPLGDAVATGSLDGKAVIWDITSGRPMVTIDATKDPAGIAALAFSPDGSMLATAGSNPPISLWKAASGEPVNQMTGQESRVNALAFSPDGRLLVSGEEDRSVRVWEVAKGTPYQAPYLGHNGSVRSIAVSSKGEVLTGSSGSADERIILWSMDSLGKLVTEVGAARTRLDATLSLAFNNAGQLMLAVDRQGEGSTVDLWNASEGRLMGAFGASPSADSSTRVETVHAAAFSPDGRLLAVASYGGLAIGDNVNNSQRVVPLKEGSFVSGIAFSANGLLAWGIEHNITVVNATAAALEPFTLESSRGDVLAVAFSPNGRLIAAANLDGSVSLWDVAGRREAALFKGHDGPVWEVAFSPDGRLLATGGLVDELIKLWDVPGRRHIADLEAHAGMVVSLTFSPDGELLASTNGDNSPTLWDVRARRLLTRSISASSGSQAGGAAFSQDGKQLAFSGVGASAVLWTMDEEGFLDAICSTANRNLTQQEWREFIGNVPYRQTCPSLPRGA